MSGSQEPSASNLDHRIEQLDEGAARILKYHSGTTLDTRISLLEALEEHFRHSPDEPVIKIHRKPSRNGRKPPVDHVKCGLCPQSGKFQRIADHVVCEHFKLTLWYCGLNSCPTSVSRKSDLDRHLRAVHNIARPREAKAERLSQGPTAVGFPVSPPTPSLLLGPGPMRHNRGRSRSMEPSFSPSHFPGDIVNRPNDNVLYVDFQRHSTLSHQEARERLNTGHPLIFGGGIYPTLVLPRTALPTDDGPSLPDASSRMFYPTHSRNSSYGLGIGVFPDAIRPSEQQAPHTLIPPTHNRQVGSFHGFGGYSSSDFLSPASRTSAASSGIGLLPLPQPVHGVPTPIQSESVQPGIYHASNPPEGMHLPLPPSSPHYPPTGDPSQGAMGPYPTTLPPDYYPTRVQINMQNAVPVGPLSAGHWRPARNTPPSHSYTPYLDDEEFGFNLSATDDLFSPGQ